MTANEKNNASREPGTDARLASAQRHQKLVEESPSGFVRPASRCASIHLRRRPVALDADLRQRLCSAAQVRRALRVARRDCRARREIKCTRQALGAEMGYVGAGTVEFIFDNRSKDFFFLEVNARVQVGAQFGVARASSLSFSLTFCQVEHPITELVVK